MDMAVLNVKEAIRTNIYLREVHLMEPAANVHTPRDRPLQPAEGELIARTS